ncbi:hypothetical protein BN7_171 [Wickerhamomyces ciferrii]|uniref:Uncharacterized protein n=1 Tax=Wickerhamomyces ciferrii (strain ATCC 14091 / BCRC 22168 / CBS 111 / JCM 3599 / NBRC 0793 / NRRL Y-1031 F-60-10) TaxID=1206466 RepID=K0KEH1_WICCF|nr:uncharacterized protein BN7_171 [Wickerhamomyces ciferrii]CCH40637.1 hypothetical protein BN7_171 [Wickerhamomyces ciferrii]
MSFLQIGSDVNENDTAITILSEELENLEKSFNKSLETIENLIKFYQLDDEQQAQDIYNTIINEPILINKLNSQIYQNEKTYQLKYREELNKIIKIHMDSFDKIQPNLELIYDQYIKNQSISELNNDIDEITPFELSQDESGSKQELSLDLNKQQLLKLIELEKFKRFKIQVINEKIYEPNIKNKEKSFEIWSNRERDLKKFFNIDLENMNKKIQLVKKTENLEI